MRTHQLLYSALLIGLFCAVATIGPPRLRDSWQRLERGLRALARRKTVCWLGIGALVLVVRVALLPIWPIPQPSVYDEFSYLLQADTFAHGRLTNPPHPLWRSFESTFVLQQPTYASRFPPGPALPMALGQVVFGHPWFGVWLSAALLAAALCWALQGWLPPGWALLGAFIGLDLCLFTYWMNSYWGGAVTAFGGALVTGAWVRITRAKQSRYAWHFGIGAVILVWSRPFEGSVLLLVALIALAAANRSPRVWLPIALIGVMGASWLAYYSYRITGDPLRLPYRQYYLQYETVPPFWFIPTSTPLPGFRQFDLEARTLDTYEEGRSWRPLVERPKAWLHIFTGYYGNVIWLLPLAAFTPQLWRSRRIRFAIIATLAMGAVSFLEVWWYPHYPAPITAALLILAAQSMRHLQQWKYRGREVGYVLARATVTAVMVLMVATQARAVARHQTVDQTQGGKNALKKTVERRLLAASASQHVIIVRYTDPSPHLEWVYNPADIDSAPVIWAQDLGPEDNERLRRYYASRSFWFFDSGSMRLTPYSSELK